MFRIDLPWSNGYLLLTPQLGELPRYAQVPILIAGFGLLLYLVFRLYRYELQFLVQGLFARPAGIAADRGRRSYSASPSSSRACAT